MKKSTLISLIGVSMIATPAFAADPSTTYELTGSVASVCSISASAGASNFTSLQTPSTVTITDANATCNSTAATVSVSRTKLTTDNVAPDGFADEVVVDTKVEAGAATVTNDGTETAGAFKSLKITATTVAPDNTLIAGDYTGTITVTLNPGA